MGGGTYSQSSRSVRAADMGYHTKAASDIFEQKHLNEGMDPKSVVVRESRDSDEHPNSLAIIIGLDQTGSMGYIPHHLIKDGLPTLMAGIMENGILDPQVMFCAIGDAHNREEAPLQISQFESSDELLDHWLTKVYLEGNGGGNNGEDYALVHRFAAQRTSIDCLEKRGEKGFLFTIGDDKSHRVIEKRYFEKYLGESEASDKTIAELIAEAQEKYHVYHVHVGTHEASGNVKNTWRELLGENFIDCPNYKEAPKMIARIIADNAVKHLGNTDAVAAEVDEAVENPVSEPKHDIIL